MTKKVRFAPITQRLWVRMPTGDSSNLDATCICLTMAALFLARAANTRLSPWQQPGIRAILLLPSKGAPGNGVATIGVATIGVAKWEGALDTKTLRAALARS